MRKCCGGGLSAIDADHVIFGDNQVYGNAWYSRYGCTGISLLVSRNFDQDTGYHVIIRGNRVWNNRGLVMGKGEPGGAGYSDGNGIIIDSDKRNNFTGRTLACNNVSFNNGGSGILSFDCQNVDIVNTPRSSLGKRVVHGVLETPTRVIFAATGPSHAPRCEALTG